MIRRRDSRLHLPPEWAEVIKEARAGLSYYRNDQTGQCCEGTPLPQAQYPKSKDPEHEGRCGSALAMLAGAVTRSRPSRRPALVGLLRDFTHGLNEATRIRAIEALSCMAGDPDALRALASRKSDDSPSVTDALCTALEHWLRKDPGCQEARRLLRKHQEAVRARAEQYPNGVAFRIDSW